MLLTNNTQDLSAAIDQTASLKLSIAFIVPTDFELYQLLAKLTPDTPWGDRKKAAQMLGDHQSPQALQGLLEALPKDPFWVVCCAIIQSLERIGNPKAIPILQEVAQNDGFQVVRLYADKAIERLS